MLSILFSLFLLKPLLPLCSYDITLLLSHLAITGNLYPDIYFFLLFSLKIIVISSKLVQINMLLLFVVVHRLVEEAASGHYLQGGQTPPCPPQPPLYSSEAVLSERTLKVQR